jgi:hypothetical protein
MFFVYLQDGRRIDIPEAASVVHRSMVLFLDAEDKIVEQFATRDIVAYSHSSIVAEEGAGETLQVAIDAEGDLLLLRRHRRPRRSRRPPEPSNGEAARAQA